MPNKSSWKLWERLITNFTTDGKQLKEPLKGWTSHHSSRGVWKSYIDNQQHGYVRQTDGTWNEYFRRGTQFDLHRCNVTHVPTQQARPAPITQFGMHTCINPTEHNYEVPSPPQPRRITNWYSFVATKPKWIQQLLRHAQFDDLDEIINQLSQPLTIQVMSDGSAKGNHMSYGWKIADAQFNYLAQGMGPVDGRPNSLRGEAGGMLAATMFLALVLEFAQITKPTAPIKFRSDNLDLIRRLIQHKDYEIPYMNQTLTAEFDLIEQIHKVHTEFSMETLFEHIKGHQDDDTPYDKLSKAAKMNVDCDELANEYHSIGPPSSLITHVLPSCPAMLVINNATISNDYRNQLTRAYTEPNYIQYLQQKYKWNNSVTQAIAWTSLSRAIRRIDKQDITTKLCTEYLPVAATLKKRSYQTTDTCCLCGATETQKHIFVCNHDSRIKWRRKLIRELLNKLEALKTPDDLTDTICTCMTEWMDTQTVTPEKYPEKHQNAINSQGNIGWYQLFLGYFSQEWEMLYITEDSPPSQRDTASPCPTPKSARWSTNIVELILRHSIELWMQRNEDVHGHTENEQHQKSIEKNTTEIERLKKLKKQTRPSDAFIFADIDEVLKKKNLKEMETWIQNKRPAIYHSIKAAKAQSVANTRSIATYFKTKRSKIIKKLRNWSQDRLIHDPYSKKKRHKQKSTGIQTRLRTFFSPGT